MDNFFKVVNAYLDRVAVTPYQMKNYLKELKYDSKYLLDKVNRGWITEEEAKPIALKHLEVAPEYVGYYFAAGIIPKDEARQFALEHLEKNTHMVDSFFGTGLLTKEEIKPFALKKIKNDGSYAIHYFGEGIITAEEAKSFVLRFRANNTPNLIYAVSQGILTKEEAKPVALDILNTSCSYVKMFFNAGIITAEEAKPFALEAIKEDGHYAHRYFDMIPKDEAKPFALENLKKNAHRVGIFFLKGIINKEEARPFALQDLKQQTVRVGFYVDRGIINKEEAKPFALKDLKRDPSQVGSFFDHTIITAKEARPFALKFLATEPGHEYVGVYLSKHLITKEEARSYNSGDVDQLIRSMPDSYTHSSHQSKHEINLILGAMKKLGVDEISWQQFQEVHKSSNKNLQNIFNTFKGKVVTRDQCLKMLGKDTEQHTYGLSYEGLRGDGPQTYLANRNQTVVKLHMPESLLSKLSPEARKRFNEIKSEHFNAKDPFGWVRVTRLGDKWFVDEIQSDKNRQIGKIQHEINKALKSGNATDDIKKDQAFIAEMQRFSNWHEVLLSALLEAARESGVHEIYMHTGDTKSSQENVKVNQTKARNLYDKLPERMMFNKKQVNLGNGEHELWHRVASRVVYGYLSKVSEVVSDAEKQKALEALKQWPEQVGKYFEDGIISRNDAKEYALNHLDSIKDSNYGRFICNYAGNDQNSLLPKVGILDPKDLRPYALEHLKKLPSMAGRYLEKGLITEEEARSYQKRSE